MGEPTQLQERLLENHLQFTELHRAKVSRREGLILWESEHPEFCCAMLQSAAAVDALDETTRAVRTFPWTGDVAEALAGRGFQKGPAMRYMRRHADRTPPVSIPGLSVLSAESEHDLGHFSDVQSQSFAEPGEALGPLRAFLHAANARNLNHPDQAFYVGVLGGIPVAATLLLIHRGTAGIYAVATLPEHRGRGLSRALLSRAMDDARVLGCDVVCLQVIAGSAAERLYTRLGFTVDFDCQLWGLTPRG